MIRQNKLKIFHPFFMLPFFMCASHSSAMFAKPISNQEITQEAKRMNDEAISNIDFLTALSLVLPVINKERAVEDLINKEFVFFDDIKPFYPKRGPISAYTLTHRNKIQVDIKKDKGFATWDKAYVTLNDELYLSGARVQITSDELKKIGISFRGLAEKNHDLMGDNGSKKIMYLRGLTSYIKTM